MVFKITQSEFRKRLGFILLGFFSFYLVSPVQEWMETNTQLNPFLVGGIGIILTLFFFDF